jgi:hypothetical protein
MKNFLMVSTLLVVAAAVGCTRAPSPEQSDSPETTAKVTQATTGVSCDCRCIGGYLHYLCDPTPSQPGSGDEFSAGGCEPFHPCY